MQKILNILSEALKWLRIGLKLFLIVRHCSEELMLLYAITRAEILGKLEKDGLVTGQAKKEYAISLLRDNFLFKDCKNLDNLVESAWLFKYHKEK